MPQTLGFPVKALICDNFVGAYSFLIELPRYSTGNTSRGAYGTRTRGLHTASVTRSQLR